MVHALRALGEEQKLERNRRLEWQNKEQRAMHYSHVCERRPSSESEGRAALRLKERGGTREPQAW